MKTRLLIRQIFLVGLLLSSSTTVLAQAVVSEEIHARFDFSGVRLQPNALGSSRSRRIDVDGLLQALLEIESSVENPVFKASAGGASVFARVGHKEVEVDPSRGIINVHDDRAYAVDSSKDGATKEELLARSAGVLAAIGVRPEESISVVRNLMVRSKLEGGSEPSKVRRIAQKLLIKRVIGGYPVSGERLILSFATDGSLRAITGRWRPLNLANSQLSSNLSIGDVSDRAMQAIENKSLRINLLIAPDVAIRIHTMLVPQDNGNDEFILSLRGRVEVPIYGPEGSILFDGIDFLL